MKNLFFLLLCSLTFALVSCGKDDDCDGDNLENVIVGEWNVTVFGLPAGDVDFNANGTLTDDTGILIANEFGGVTFDSKTYEVQSNNTLVLRAHSGNDFIEEVVDVTSFECDEITVDYQGTAVVLKRE